MKKLSRPFGIAATLNKVLGYAAFMLIPLSTPLAHAHDGYHYAGLSGTALSTDTSIASIMMPRKPSNCPGGDCHVIGWTVLWDAYATGQYVEGGIGYDKSHSSNVMLWWASERHGLAHKVASVPYGTWVTILLYKPNNQDHVIARWRWIDSAGSQREVVKEISTPGWFGNMAYHPTKAEVYTVEGHPGNVELHFSGVWQWPGDHLAWHVEGPWIPVGTFSNFVVTKGP